MSQIVYTGTAGGLAAVAQVDTFTPANVEIGDVFTLTDTADDGGTLAIAFTATVATVANVTAGLVAAWNASTHRQATGKTAADNTTNLTLTADEAGVPFSVAATATDGGGANTQTLTRAATTANVGASDVSKAANYLANAVFVASDTLTLNGLNAADLLYGLNQSSITLTAFNVKQSNTFQVGNADRAYYFRVSATTLNIGQSEGDGTTDPSGPTFIAIDTGTNASTTNVFKTNSAGLNGGAALHLKGAHASNVLNVLGGNVDVANLNPGDTANYPNIYVGGGRTTRLTLSSGVTAPTLLSQDDGSVLMYCGATTLKQDGGTLTIAGSGNVTTLWAGGVTKLTGTGKVTTAEVPKGGTLDCSGIAATAAAPVTFAGDIILHAGAKLILDNGVPGSLVCDNPVQLYHCNLQDVTITLPKHMKVTIAKI